ncbi:MAG: hypothetical protein HKM02_12030 [Pseudomonadales bacterium]|nr:hypothetical protein [Pseudomonadales bacterium]
MVSNTQPDARQLAYLAALDIAVMQRTGNLSGADGAEPWMFLPWMDVVATMDVQLPDLIVDEPKKLAITTEELPQRPQIEPTGPSLQALLPQLVVQCCELTTQWIALISHMEQELPASVWPFLTQLARWLGRREALVPGPLFRFPPAGLARQRYEPHDYKDAMQGLLMRFRSSGTSLLVLGAGLEPWLDTAWPEASMVVQPGLAVLLSSSAAKSQLFKDLASC